MPRRSRYREAQARRAAKQRDADRAVRTTTQIASAAVLLAFTVTIIAVLKGPEGFAALRPLARPILGPFTGLELIATAFIAGLFVMLLRRLRK